MKLIQSYGALTIKSDITADQFSKAQKYAPKALTLYEEKNAIFAINAAPTSNTGSISKHGITFNDCTANGELFVTIAYSAPTDPTAVKACLEEEFGMILFNLKKIEDQVTEAVGAAAAAIATVADSITIG